MSPVCILVILDVDPLDRYIRVQAKSTFLGVDFFSKRAGRLNIAIMLEKLKDLFSCIVSGLSLSHTDRETYKLLDKRCFVQGWCKSRRAISDVRIIQ